MERQTKFILGSFFLILFLLVLTPFADPNPDGLESAAQELEGSALDLGFFTDYGSEGSILYEIIGNEQISVILSGIIGVCFVIGIFLVPLIIIKNKSNHSSN